MATVTTPLPKKMKIPKKAAAQWGKKRKTDDSDVPALKPEGSGQHKRMTVSAFELQTKMCVQ